MSSSLENHPVADQTKKLLETLGDQLLHIKAPTPALADVKPSFDTSGLVKQAVRLDGQAAHAEPIKPKDVF